MRSCVIWSVVLLCVAELGGVACGAATTEVVSSRRREPNPALLYWQGVALLPQLTKADRQLPLDVSGGRLAADAPAVRGLLEKVRPALQRFRRASMSETWCDWGITLDEGPYAVMPHLANMQFLCRLAVLQGEYLFVVGRAEEGFEWMLAVHRAARHVGEGGMLAALLEEYSMDSLALRATARHVEGLDANLRFGHRQQLDLLPDLHGVGDGLRGEQLVAEWLHRMVLGLENAPDVEKALAEMRRLAKEEAGGGDAAKQQMPQLLVDWQAQHVVIGKVFGRLREACKLPWEQATAELKVIAEDPALSIPAVQNLYLLIENHLRKRLETETQQRMLKAALMLGAEIKPGMVSGWQDAFFNEPLVVKVERGQLVITMRQLVGTREVVLRLGARVAGS